MMTDFSPSKMVWAFLALSVNFITPFPCILKITLEPISLGF